MGLAMRTSAPVSEKARRLGTAFCAGLLMLSGAASAQAPTTPAATTPAAPPATGTPAPAGKPAPKAGEREADTCVRTKIWAGYEEGWAVRSATSAKLASGEHRVYVVTLEAGLEYKFIACGDSKMGDLDLVLHDMEGKELARDKGDDREPTVLYKPTKTGEFYLAVFAASVLDGATESGVSTSVTYR